MSVYEHNVGDHEDPLAGPTWLIGVLSMILLSVIVLGVTAMYRHARTERDTERQVLQPAERLALLKQQQLAQLQTEPQRQEFKVGEETVTRIIIPVEDAIDLVIEEYATGN